MIIDCSIGRSNQFKPMDSGYQAIETEKAQNNNISEMEMETGNWKMDNFSHNP